MNQKRKEILPGAWLKGDQVRDIQRHQFNWDGKRDVVLIDAPVEPGSRERLVHALNGMTITGNRSGLILSSRAPEMIKFEHATRWEDVAWRDMKHRFGGKQNKLGMPKSLEVATLLRIGADEIKSLGPVKGTKKARSSRVSYQVGVAARDALERFYKSTADAPQQRHLPASYRMAPAGTYDARIGEQALMVARAAWRQECSPESKYPTSEAAMLKQWLAMARTPAPCVFVPYGETLTPAQCRWLSHIETKIILIDDPILRETMKFDPAHEAFNDVVKGAQRYSCPILEESPSDIARVIGAWGERLSGHKQTGMSRSTYMGDIPGLTNFPRHNGWKPGEKPYAPVMISLSRAGQIEDAIQGLHEGMSMLLPNDKEMAAALEQLRQFHRLANFKGDPQQQLAPDAKFLKRFPSVQDAELRTTHDRQARDLLYLAMKYQQTNLERDIDFLIYSMGDAEFIRETSQMRPVELCLLHELEDQQQMIEHGCLGCEFYRSTADSVKGDICQDALIYRAMNLITKRLEVKPLLQARFEYYRQRGLEIAREEVKEPPAAIDISQTDENRLAQQRAGFLAELEARRAKTSSMEDSEPEPDVSAPSVVSSTKPSPESPAPEKSVPSKSGDRGEASSGNREAALDPEVGGTETEADKKSLARALIERRKVLLEAEAEAEAELEDGPAPSL